MIKSNKKIRKEMAFKSKIKVFMMFAMAILMINFVSSELFTFDNYKYVTEESHKVTISNLFGLGSKIAEVKLNTPINNQVPIGYGKVAEFTINSSSDYVNALSRLKLYDKNNKLKEINKNFDYKTLIYEDVTVEDYECVYSKKYNSFNKTYDNICTNTKVGSHIEKREKWVDLTSFDFSKGETKTIGIFTNVEKGEKIEWIPNYFGVNINEWATWTASLNASIWAYWKMDESAGTVATDYVNWTNGTWSSAPTWQSGKINNGAYEDGTITMNTNHTLVTVRNYTFSCWLNGSAITDRYIWGNGDTGTPNGLFRAKGTSDGKISIDVRESGVTTISDVRWTESVFINDSLFHLLIYTYNEEFNVWTVSVDGTRLTLTDSSGGMGSNSNQFDLGGNTAGGGSTWKGMVDECAIWTRNISNSEEVDLYNGGLGISYGAIAGTDISVLLSTPRNNTYHNKDINFSSNMTMDASIVLDNSTLYIWNSTLDIYNKTANTTIDAKTNSSFWNVSNFDFGNYHWNTYSCGTNTTGQVNCFWAVSNYTFSWRPFSISSQTSIYNVSETSNQKYELNITTLSSILSVNSKLFYNGTSYPAVTSCDTGVCNIYRRIDVPLVQTGESANRSFFWNITLYDGDTSYSFDTTSDLQWQMSNRVHLEQCTTTTYTNTTINLTAWDEKNLTQVTDYKIGSTLSYWLGNGSTFRNVSIYNVTTNQTLLCINPLNVTYKIDGIVDYEKENSTYVKRNWFFQNSTTNNTIQNIFLYLLDATDSTTFIIKAQDQKLSAVESALVYIQRYYPSDNTYKTVQIAKTDDNGETVGFYETETVEYKHFIIKSGIVLLETNKQKVVGKEVPYTLTFTTGESLEAPWNNWEDNPNIITNLSYNNKTKLVTFSYIDITGETYLGRLLVKKESASNSTVITICNKTSTESSATLTCNMSLQNGTFIATGIVGTEDNITDILKFIIETAREIFSNTGLILGFFIILTAGMAFIWNPTLGIVGINASLWLVSLIGLISFSYVFLFAIMAVSIIAIILLKT